jgi:hypothetical protein
MPVASAKDADVKRHDRVIGERPHPVLVQRARKRSLVIGPAAKVEGGMHERVVHRHGAITVPGCGRRRHLPNRGPERDGNVLNEVVAQVSLRVHLEVQTRIPCQRREHVVQKLLARGDTRRSGTACDRDPNACLAGVSHNFRHS